jgi:hypothetical protein
MLAGDYCTIQTQFEQGDKLFVSLVFRFFVIMKNVTGINTLWMTHEVYD